MLLTTQSTQHEDDILAFVRGRQQLALLVLCGETGVLSCVAKCSVLRGETGVLSCVVLRELCMLCVAW